MYIFFRIEFFHFIECFQLYYKYIGYLNFVIAYRENIEATSKLCYKCNQYVNKILSLQEQRYNLSSIRMNNQMVNLIRMYLFVC